MENIADHCPDRRDCLITIILDGENAWEYYPENGYHFLNQIYAAIADHPRLELSTFGRFLNDKRPNIARESRVVAGSWVHGNFSTWIGDQDKNRGWSLLIEAKQAFDRQVAAGVMSAKELRMAQELLAICEGSDWFWWFGDYNPSATVGQFEQLFRMHLANLYQILKAEAPPSLADVISRGGGNPSRGGVMRHGDGGQS
jgi:alpha-amylase/alpha-mannosidase (GH57 family)